MNAKALTPLFLALRDIKLAHTVFALPFALLAAVLVLPPEDTPATVVGKIVLVVLCMFFARTWAMLVNRAADAQIDAKNERTAQRAVASGRLSRANAWATAFGSALLFCVTAIGFLVLYANPWPALLAAPVLGFIALYSFTKRFTALCHLFLGAALAVSPLAAVIAVDPSAFVGSEISPGLAAPALWISAFVLLWVAGFDVIYALQDLDFDRDAGLHSIPAALGWRGAVWISRLLHAGALAALVFAIRAEPRFEIVTVLAAVGVAILLVVEHAILIRRGAAGIPMAFFTYNGIISLLLGAAGILDLTLL